MAYNLPDLEGGYRGWQATLSLLPAGKEKSYRLGGMPANTIVVENQTEPLPQSASESLARALLPQMQAFFESEQGKQALKQWREERERHS